MKTLLEQISLLSIVLLSLTCCSKTPMPLDLHIYDSERCIKSENVSGVELYFMLLNTDNVVIDSFRLGENVSFVFYLQNNTNSPIVYNDPCSELTSLLNVFAQDTLNNTAYKFIGRPSINCVMVARFSELKRNTAIKLGSFSFNEDIGWPKIERGSYFVGDSIKLSINSKNVVFYKRIHFKIY